MRAVIFCGGNIEDYTYINCLDALIICADGGLCHAEKLGITPDAVIGDNDSYTGEYPKDIRVIVCPEEKDYTDTQKCIDYAIEKGCSEVLIYGGLGGRLDHEYSNYCLLAYAIEKGVRVVLINEHNEIWMENKPFVLEKSDKKYVSFFPYGGLVEEFSIKGLKYELEGITLNISSTQTVSNEFLDKNAEISFKQGMVLVMLCDDTERSM